MAKRDYYEVLGVDKNASADEIKNWLSSTIRTRIPAIRKPRRSSRRRLRPTPY